MNFRTKPRGMWANFETECAKCAGELTVTNGRVDNHECRERIDLDNPLTLADINAALDNR